MYCETLKRYEKITKRLEKNNKAAWEVIELQKATIKRKDNEIKELTQLAETQRDTIEEQGRIIGEPITTNPFS